MLNNMKDASGIPFASVRGALARKIPHRKQPTQQRALHTLAAIHEGTLQVLLRDGYAALTTTRVAERAGVSVGTLYQYYPDKAALVTTLKVRYLAAMLSAMRGALAENGKRSLEEVLRAALAALLKVKQSNRALTLALRVPMAELGAKDLARSSLDEFVAILHPGLQRSTRRKIDVKRVRLLAAALEGAIAHAVHEAPEWLAEAWFLDDLVTLAAGYLEARRRRG
jgi:AcrR family transcriptional regulator